MTLDKLPIGKEAVITAVGGEGALRCRLLDMGYYPTHQDNDTQSRSMGDPIEIHLRGYELTIRLEDAQKIDVMPIETEE